tara:strand:+ start:13402 stop:13743 length:342 start_codon:yes stop_codon:yes gene_type:complete
LFFGKEVRVLLKGQAKESYLHLKKKTDKDARTLLNSFSRIKEILKDNPQYGDPIPKQLIPKSLQKIGVKNLYRVELSNYWRMLYTLEGSRIEVFVFVLNIVDHKNYNRLFGYK